MTFRNSQAFRPDSPSRRRATRGALARFGVVGLLGTAVYYAILWVLVDLVQTPVMFATSFAFIIVCIENYILHYRWTFDSAKMHAAAFPRFLFMSVVGFAINWGIMFLGVTKLGLHYLLLQAFAIAAVVLWNFILSSYWVFRDRHPATDRAG